MRIETDAAQFTRNHWYWRAGWRPGRRMVTFHITMERAPQVRQLASEVEPVLAEFSWVDPVPVQGLHLTMTGVGFTDDVSPTQVDAIADEVFASWTQTARTELNFTSMVVGWEGLMLMAELDPWLADLADTQRRAVDRVLGRQSWDPLWPHTSLGYFNDTGDPVGLARAVESVAGKLPAVLPATPTLTLMELRRAGHLYTWDTLRQG